MNVDNIDVNNTEEVAEYIKQVVNFDHQFEMMFDVGDTLNGRMDRFDKAKIIETGIEVYSDGKLKYVDETGRDHFIPALKIYTEMKKTNILTDKRKVLKKTITVKLMNSQGDKKSELPDTFKYLLLIDNDCCAIVSREDIIPYITFKDDGISLDIPSSKVTMIAKNHTLYEKTNNFSYKDEKNKMIQTYLRKFKDGNKP